MSPYQLAARHSVSRKFAKKICAIRDRLSSDQQLSVPQLLDLIGNPENINFLGNYKERARDQVGELGYVRAGAAPPHVAACILGTAEGDTESVAILMRWIKSVLPPRPVRYHWIAVRLLIALGPNLRKADFKHVWLATKNVRAHPDFDGWWSSKKDGWRNSTIYHRPKMLFDL